MKADFPITCGEDAIDNLIQHCRSHQRARFTVNTLGRLLGAW